MAAPTASTVARLAIRGSEGLWMANGFKDFQPISEFPREEDSGCKVMTFSHDGSLLAWCTGERLKVVRLASYEVLYDIDHSRLACIEFSPRATFLAVWEPYRVDKAAQTGIQNLHFYDMSTGALAKSFFQKKQTGWMPQWSGDEGICARSVNNELQFCENNNMDNIVNKLHIQKVTEYSISPSTEPYYVAAYVPGSKGQPSFIRVYRYPNFGGPSAALANKSFFKAERINFYWNIKGTAFLLLTSTEMSDSSYYGDQGLHHINTNGETSLVHLGKNGPIYHIEWNPQANGEFTVVYGYMPSKATTYNHKCEPLFDFGTGPRNAVYYNAFGNILVLAGFGNLRGNMEFWDMNNYKLICQTKAEDSTILSWCADGEHLVSATLSPRLRMGNGYKIWHYTGCCLHHEKTTANQALWQVAWQPVPPGTYKQQPIKYRPVDGSTMQTEKSAVYRPPSAAGHPRTEPLHTYESASNVKQPQLTENMSKAALKNRKKREAKKAKQEDQASAEEGQQQHAPMGGNPVFQQLTGHPDTDKKIRGVVKKLQQIEKLKDQQRAGKPLENNQLDKLKTEEGLLEELHALQIS